MPYKNTLEEAVTTKIVKRSQPKAVPYTTTPQTDRHQRIVRYISRLKQPSRAPVGGANSLDKVIASWFRAFKEASRASRGINSTIDAVLEEYHKPFSSLVEVFASDITEILANNNSDAINSILSQIHDLINEEDPDEIRPTEYAYKGVSNFLWRALSLARHDFPKGAVAVNDEGALYIYWQNGDKRLQLTYPANDRSQPYIYYRQGKDSDLLPNSSPQQLVERLHWLVVS